MSLAAVPGAAAALPAGETVTVSRLCVDGVRVTLHLTVSTRLPPEVRLGPLLTPEKVLCSGATGGARGDVARPMPPPPSVLRRGGGLLAVYVRVRQYKIPYNTKYNKIQYNTIIQPDFRCIFQPCYSKIIQNKIQNKYKYVLYTIQLVSPRIIYPWQALAGPLTAHGSDL